MQDHAESLGCQLDIQQENMSFLKEIYRYKAHGDVSLTSLSVVCIWDICVVAEVHRP